MTVHRDLNQLAAVSRPYPLPDVDAPGDGGCPLQAWLETLRQQSAWRPLISDLTASHQRLHAEMDRLAEAARSADADRMRRIYLTAALPQVCAFRQGLRGFSLALKARTAARQATMLPLTREEHCPLRAIP